MKFDDKIKEIKKALLENKFVISLRNSGKTSALAEILIENRRAIVITPNYRQKQRLIELLRSKYNAMSKQIERRIVPSYIANDRNYFIGLERDILDNIYVDEYFISSYRGPYKSAVSSLPYNTKEIK